MWRKGDFVINPKTVSLEVPWGTGILLEDQRGDDALVFFEDVAAAKRVRLLNDIHHESIKPSESSRSYLENLLIDADGPYTRQPFRSMVSNFVEDFGGFTGDVFNQHERDYKVKAHEYSVKFLDEESFSSLLQDDDFEELSSRIKTLYSKTNLLASFESIKLNDAFKNPSSCKILCVAIYDLLYGHDSLKDRLTKIEADFSQFEINKWPVITYLLFIRFPDKYMFVKPIMTKAAAEARGYDIQYDSKVNYSTYSSVLEFSKNLWVKLVEYQRADLVPRDMIDIQSFMWCTFADGWSREDILAAKKS